MFAVASALRIKGSAVGLVLLLLALASTAVAVRLYYERQAITNALLEHDRMALHIQLQSLFLQAASVVDIGAAWPPVWHSNPGMLIEARKEVEPCEQYGVSSEEAEYIDCFRIEIEASTRNGGKLSRYRVLAVGDACGTFWLL